MTKQKILQLLLVIIIYAASTGISYAIFSSSGVGGTKIAYTPPTKNAQGNTVFDQSLPKTEECPINGAKYSKQQRDWWEQHRPLGVMIENHEDARPQSGISSADVVYEAVAEGAITRFLAVFYCQDPGVIGPVRSARTYFVDFISEYGDFPLYAHVGGANTPGPADALGQINDYDWFMYNDINEISNGDLGFPIFLRDYNRNGHEVATEHTMYSTAGDLWKVAKNKRKLTNVNDKGDAWDADFVKYTFKDDAKEADRPASQTVHVEFWGGYRAYFVDWKYDKATNTYKRENGGKPHIDRDNNKQLSPKNIAVLQMQESHANDGYTDNAHLLYKNKGSGKATFFMDGKQINGTWKKASRTARTLLYDASGNALSFNRGQIWFEVVPTDGVVTAK
jgi:hypothetical protein